VSGRDEFLDPAERTALGIGGLLARIAGEAERCCDLGKRDDDERLAFEPLRDEHGIGQPGAVRETVVKYYVEWHR
jgi:hypothetical protein